MNYARYVEEGIGPMLDRPPGITNGLLEWVRAKFAPENDEALSRIRAIQSAAAGEDAAQQSLQERVSSAQERRARKGAESERRQSERSDAAPQQERLREERAALEQQRKEQAALAQQLKEQQQA